MEIPDGSYASIIGSNGSGKSTLLKLMLGFLKPSSGRISLGTTKIGYVPQKDSKTMSSFPITVRELLSSYCAVKGALDKGAPDEALRAVGLDGFGGRLLSDLSGGERERVLIARALLGDNELLILDEPSTGVDPEAQRELYALLRRLNRDRGLTIIAVEHNLKEAVRSSSMMLHLANGSMHLCSRDQFISEEADFHA